MKTKSSLIVFGTFAAMAASASPTLWNGNGHYYELITGVSPTWEQANAAASSMSYFDGGVVYKGYLATVTSAAENDFIVGLGDVQGLYLGAQHVNGGGAGDYNWVTGEAFVYTNWAGGEPNGDSGAIQYNVGGTGTWNDLPNGQYAGTRFVRGYVVEYASSVPGPMAALPFALGFLRRRRKSRL